MPSQALRASSPKGRAFTERLDEGNDMKLLNEILGTKYPIIQGGMANIATGEFAAACSNAGALGLIGAGGMNAETLRENIRRCKDRKSVV